MRDERRSDDPSDGPDDAWVDRLQAIDEQIAGGLPNRIEPQDQDIERVKDVLQLINRMRTRDGETDCDSAIGASGDTPKNPDEDQAIPMDRLSSRIPRVGWTIGNYLVEEEIARGGMGIVFRARDLKLNRDVALKILRAGPLARHEDRIRFRGEAEAAARLDHPGIVPVYEVGDHDGVLYFTMGLIRGECLSDQICQSPLDPQRAAEIAKQIAEAAQYAHQRGVVHRDLKPANVLFDQHDRVRVTDFGLARRIDSGSELTETGQVVGTPEYMAPEQASGNASKAGPSADIYSIGATLYCMLTGQPPFRSSGSIETLRKVMEQEPISLRKFNRLIPTDLETICLRCLEKQPTKRYTDAASLARDLNRFLIGEPIEARRPRIHERVMRYSRRHPLAASLVALLIFFAIIGPIIATSQMRLAREAQLARDSMAQTLYTSDMNLAMRDWEQANLHRCGELLKRHIPARGRQDLRGFEWYFLWNKWQKSENVPVVFRDDQLESMAISADDQILAVGCFDGRLILWDLDRCRQIHSWKAHPYRTYHLAFSHDSTILASASIDNEVSLWDVQTGQLIRRFDGSRAVSFSPADHSFAYRTAGRSIHIHRSPNDEPILIPKADNDYVEAITHSPDGRYIASAGWDNDIHIWDTATGELSRTLSGHPHGVWSLDWSPSGSLLVSGDVNGNVLLWDAASGEVLSTISGHTLTINAITFAPDSETFASASADNTVEIRSVTGRSLRQRLKVHAAEINDIAYANGGRSLLTASVDGTVKKWSLDVDHGDDVLVHPAPVSSVDFFPDGRRIVTTCYDGKIRYWNVADGRLIDEFVGHQNNIWRARVASFDDSTRVITSGQDGSICVWDADTDRQISKLDTIPNALNPLPIAISPDQSRFAYSRTNHETGIWDLRHHRLVVAFESERAEDIAYSMDGTLLLTSTGPLMSLRDANTGELLKQWTGGSKVVTRVRCSPDGRSIAAATHNRLVKTWDYRSLLDPESGQVESPTILTGSSGIIAALTYSRDGSLVASAGDDQNIRLWDTRTGQQRAAIVGHTGAIVDLVFSPDDQVLASASSDHTVRLWRGERTSNVGAH